MDVKTPRVRFYDEDAHLRARISKAKFWLEFSLFDDGLDSARTTTPPHFHRFPDLPPEIRLQIWSCLIVPRIVTACCFERDGRLPLQRKKFEHRSAASSRGASGRGRGGSGTTTTPTSTETTTIFNPTCPVLLRTCRESRALALQHYELTFGWNISELLIDTPIARPPRVWFNFGLDALYLAGKLEACDLYGFKSPFVYFLRREDTRRVRHIACAFEELHYPEQESDQIFGCLWHVVDRFQAARRLLLAVTPRDEEAMAREGRSLVLSTDNVMQKIWNGWILGTTVASSSLADTQILLIREGDLAGAMACHAWEDEGQRAR